MMIHVIKLQLQIPTENCLASHLDSILYIQNSTAYDIFE